MLDNRTQKYADTLAAMLRVDTTSYEDQTDKTAFYRFHELLKEKFPHIFSVVEYEDFSGSFLLKWKGEGALAPILLMNHHDVVEASGDWHYPPFSGEIAEGKIWGRGTLDDKGGLWAMLQASLQWRALSPSATFTLCPPVPRSKRASVQIPFLQS